MTNRYFCRNPDEAVESRVIDAKGCERTVYTYFESDKLFSGFEWVEIGAEVPLHCHETSEEIIFCTHGEGQAEVDGVTSEMRPGTMIHIPMGVIHKFVNTSSTERLGFTLTLTPHTPIRKFMANSNQNEE